VNKACCDRVGIDRLEDTLDIDMEKLKARCGDFDIWKKFNSWSGNDDGKYSRTSGFIGRGRIVKGSSHRTMIS
jgi:hypothetical protein